MELLKNLYNVFSPSGKEKKMRKFIKDYVRKNIPGVEFEQDKAGNIYFKKGASDTYPCIVAHMDQVQNEHEKDFTLYLTDGMIWGFSKSALLMRGLGADDKNGIWVALKCLEKYDVLKCAFFVGEEIGCVGSSRAKMSFFDDCRWVVQCDRKNRSDLITIASCTELCSQEFIDALHMEQFGYKETTGLMTDVMTLKERGLKVSCINMSCGYYRPHTDEEFTVVSDLKNCLAFVEWIVENVTDVYPHEYVKKVWHNAYGGGYQYGKVGQYGSYGGYGSYGSYGSYGKYGKYGSWDDDEDWRIDNDTEENDEETVLLNDDAQDLSDAEDYIHEMVYYDPNVTAKELCDDLNAMGVSVEMDFVVQVLSEAKACISKYNF